MIAEYRIAVGVLRFYRQSSTSDTHVVRLGTGAGKVEHGVALIAVNGDLQGKARPIVKKVDRLERFPTELAAHFTEEVTNSLLGSVHDRPHVKVDCLKTLLVD